MLIALILSSLSLSYTSPTSSELQLHHRSSAIKLYWSGSSRCVKQFDTAISFTKIPVYSPKFTYSRQLRNNLSVEYECIGVSLIRKVWFGHRYRGCYELIQNCVQIDIYTFLQIISRKNIVGISEIKLLKLFALWVLYPTFCSGGYTSNH